MAKLETIGVLGDFTGFDPVADVSSLNWSKTDTHVGCLSALRYYMQEAVEFRRKVVENIVELAKAQHNMFLKTNDRVSQDAAAKASLADKQQRDNVKKRWFSAPVMIGATELRKNLYGALPMDFECSRLTTSDDDYTIAEFIMDLSNRFLRDSIREVMPIYLDKLVWQFRPWLWVEWDRVGGVQIERPILTADKTSKYSNTEVLNKAVTPEELKRWNISGTGFWKRDKSGNLMVADPVVTGMPRVSALGPMEYLLDPACGTRGLRGARYAAVQRVVDASEVMQAYCTGDEYKALRQVVIDSDIWTSRLTISEAEATIWSLREIASEGLTQTKCVLNEVMVLPRQVQGLPQGLHAIFLTGSGADDESFTNGVVLRWEPLRWPYTIPGRDDGVEITTSGYYFGDTNTRLTMGLQRGMNQMFSSMMHNAAKAGRSLAFATGVDTKNPKADVQSLGSDDSLVVVPGDQAKISVVNLGGANAQIQAQFVHEFVEAMRLSTNSSPGFSGSEELATVAQRGIMQQASVANGVKQSIGAAVSGTMLTELLMCQRYLSVPDLVSILPDKDPTEARLFKDAELRHGTQVRLRPATFFAGNMQARLSFIAMAAQGKELFEKHMPVEQIRELLNFGDELGPTSADRHIERAEKENAMLRRGPIRGQNEDGELVELPNCGVLTTDGHAEHIPVHLAPLADPGREMLSAEYKKRLLEHVGVHIKAVRQMQQEQMADQILAEKMAATKMSAMGGTSQGQAQQPPAQ